MKTFRTFLTTDFLQFAFTYGTYLVLLRKKIVWEDNLKRMLWLIEVYNHGLSPKVNENENIWGKEGKKNVFVI